MAGEIKKAWQHGRKNYNKLSLLKPNFNKNKPKKEPAKKSAVGGTNKSSPQALQSPTGHVKLTTQNAPKTPKEIPAGVKFYDSEGKLHRREGNSWTTLNNQKRWQSGLIDHKTAFSQYLEAVKTNKAFIPKNKKGTNTQPHKEQIMKKKTNEGLADIAGKVDQDHEVQMARSDLYKLAEYSIKLHDMLKSIPEEQGIEGWQQAKITKAADYISSVFHNLDYDMKFPPNNSVAMKDMPTAEGKYKSDAQRKAIHAAKNAKAKKESTDPYITILRQQLSEKAVSKDQQRAAGIALKHKKEGTKPAKGSASAGMMNMSTKELEKLAGTKHKGLPKDKS